MEIPPISEAIIKDHAELKHYYENVVNTADHDRRERFGNQFVWELARHLVGEEIVVYPAFERLMGDDGRIVAERDRKQHHEIKEMLKVFQNLKPDDSQYLDNLKELWDTLCVHIKQEEKEDLPALETGLIENGRTSEAKEMAVSFERTKALVPSRSHPSEGEHPPFETALGLLMAPIDHVKDVFRKFPERPIP